MSAVNGPVFLLVIALLIAIAAALHALTHPDHTTHQKDRAAMKEPQPMSEADYQPYADRARRAGTEYASTHPAKDAPLSGEYAGDLTPDQLMRDIGLDPYETAAEDSSALCDLFEDAYFSAQPTIDAEIAAEGDIEHPHIAAYYKERGTDPDQETEQP